MFGRSISRSRREVMTLLIAKGMLGCLVWNLQPVADSSVSPVHVLVDKIWQQSRHMEVLPGPLLRDLSKTTSTHLLIFHQHLSSALHPRTVLVSMRGAAIPLSEVIKFVFRELKDDEDDVCCCARSSVVGCRPQGDQAEAEAGVKLGNGSSRSYPKRAIVAIDADCWPI
jgi:hypothetical protein